MSDFKKISTMVIIFIILSLISTGCGKQDADNDKNNNNYIQIKGSDTIVNLSQMWAEDYMSQKENINISVTGGGSGTGIAALTNQNVDIANSSRAIKEEELKRAQDNEIEPVELVVALDGLSVITNTDNNLQELTLQQIAEIFKGNITNWQEVGGTDREITTYGRQSNSGTFVYFQDTVLKGDYTADMKRMNGNAQIVEAVKNDKSAVGYVGIGYVVKGEKVIDGLNLLNIARDDESPAASPLKEDNVKTGAYPLARPLYQYTNGKPEGKILDFIKYEMDNKGQDLAIKEGFYPISSEYRKKNNKYLK
ncbi:MAG: PstS family phosphate ABC transporter substrate-binding protein [Halothermotrichaceae bacterium]